MGTGTMNRREFLASVESWDMPLFGPLVRHRSKLPMPWVWFLKAEREPAARGKAFSRRFIPGILQSDKDITAVFAEFRRESLANNATGRAIRRERRLGGSLAIPYEALVVRSVIAALPEARRKAFAERALECNRRAAQAARGEVRHVVRIVPDEAIAEVEAERGITVPDSFTVIANVSGEYVHTQTGEDNEFHHRNSEGAKNWNRTWSALARRALDVDATNQELTDLLPSATQS